MESKTTFTVDEIKLFVDNDIDLNKQTCFAIIRQLLAKVDEAAKIEDEMRWCVAFRAGIRSAHIAYDSDGDINACWYYNEDGKLPERKPSLLDALTSLVGGGK